MKHVTINGIVRSYLNTKGKPLHYYARCLKFAADGLTELLYDTLKLTNTVRISVNEFGEAEIPDDYIDHIKVGTQVGQFIRPLIQKDTINRLPNFDTTGNQISFANPETQPDLFDSIQWIGVNFNTNGENTGGYYGLGAGSEPDTYEIIEERNVIQVNQNVPNTKIVLEYIGDGSFVNSATRITPYAQKTVEAYIDWQYEQTGAAKQNFDIMHGKLRARLDDLTPELLIRIMNRHRKASIK